MKKPRTVKELVTMANLSSVKRYKAGLEAEMENVIEYFFCQENDEKCFFKIGDKVAKATYLRSRRYTPNGS